MNAPVLRDIQLPDANLWWPPAPGWWLLLLLLAALMVLGPRLWRWWRRETPRRAGLGELERIRIDFQTGGSEADVLNRVAGLLRRVTISYYGREYAASLSGDDWMTLLRGLVPEAVFTEAQLDLLGHARYRAERQIEATSLIDACEQWLRRLPARGNHVPA